MSWKGFLPENAIVMRRRPYAAANLSPAHVEIAPDSVALSSAAAGTLTATPAPAQLQAPASTLTPPTGAHPATPAAETLLATPRARLVFVSDTPADGGAPGELLEKMIAAMTVPRGQVRLISLLPAGIAPSEERLREGRANLLAQLDELRPEAVVALGQAAARALFADSQSISSLRGKFRKVGEWNCIATFHPADLLRAPDAKRETWADLKLVAKELALPISRS